MAAARHTGDKPDAAPHIPVMLDQVLEALSPCDGGVYVDGTFGAGGYSRAILAAADCRVIGIDRDMTAIEGGQSVVAESGGRLTLLHGCFGDVAALLARAGVGTVDGFVLDIGVSSMQIDQAARGFSFRADGPLDMRMDASGDGRTAADIVNETPETALADLIYRYGEERLSRRVAKAIVRARAEAPITRTAALADVIRAVVPRSGKDGIDPATRTFQALRIAVNDELGELERALESAASILNPGGALVVVSFHSLEDSIVKHFLKTHSGRTDRGSRHLPLAPPSSVPALFTLPSAKAAKPSSQECAANPRARSARMRVAIRTSSPHDPSTASDALPHHEVNQKGGA